MNKETLLSWLKAITNEGDLPSNCQAIYIGLFESTDNYMIHFLGSVSFDRENDDWACHEEGDYLPENRYFDSTVKRSVDWASFETNIVNLVNEIRDTESTILNQINHIAIGFDSGELNYL